MFRSILTNSNGTESHIYQLLMVFLKVLFLVLFFSHCLYTTTLSSLISHSTLNHHFYADDTQLFISFSAPNFSKNILHLQDTISKESAWMSSQMLSLDHSKTEFLLIGLPKQLSEMSNPLIRMSP